MTPAAAPRPPFLVLAAGFAVLCAIALVASHPSMLPGADDAPRDDAVEGCPPPAPTPADPAEPPATPACDGASRPP